MPSLKPSLAGQGRAIASAVTPRPKCLGHGPVSDKKGLGIEIASAVYQQKLISILYYSYAFFFFAEKLLFCC